MGVRAGSRGLMLHVVTMGLVSLFLEPLIRVLGNVKRLWSLGNGMLAGCMVLTVVISAVAGHARGGSGPPEVVEPPPAEVRAYCYGLFAIFGIPQARQSIPKTLALAKARLALGLLNLAIVIPQMGVTLISGPLDSLFGGSNLPAFILGGFAAAAGGFAALQLPDPVWEMPRVISRVLIPERNTVVVQKLLDEINVGHQHSSAAITNQTQSIKGIP
ncbi:sucrose transport protein, partial [Striga asiatica]